MRAAFVSYASTDRRQALAVCEALERRGVRCWIACRDVQLGQNYQEEIVRAIRSARAMVLVFSHNANASDEIKKELSLASRHRTPVMTLRLEDVEPSDAFAYELATRQWLDLFADREGALDTLTRRVEDVDPGEKSEGAPAPALVAGTTPTRRARWRRPAMLAAGLVALVGSAAVAGFLLLRPPPPAAARTMTVRLTPFDRASSDAPASLPDGLKDEIASSFSNDGLVNVSTAAKPPPGDAPAYALGGAVRRDGDTIRVAARLTDERSGAALWSNSFAYPADKAGAVPRRVALAVESLTRCGLFGASTYPRPLPDPTLTAYLQFCQNTVVDGELTKAADFARRAVAATPDFSWGWSAVAFADSQMLIHTREPEGVDTLRREGLAAVATALKLDPSNSEALSRQSQLMDQGDLVGRDALLRRAVSARPLACGCEHDIYGFYLEEVGRETAAAAEFQRAMDVWSLNSTAREELGELLVQSGHPAAAKAHFDAVDEIDDDPMGREITTVYLAPVTRDYAGAISSLSIHGPKAPGLRDAWVGAFRALESGSREAKDAAAAKLVALDVKGEFARNTANFLGALGHGGEALKLLASAVEAGGIGRRGWLFYPTLHDAWRDPAFAPLAERVGLVSYWRATHTRPDLCADGDPPPVCRLL